MQKIKKNIPVALFLWRRPYNTRIILDMIVEYNPEKLFVIVDGPRNDSELSQIEDVMSAVLEIKNNISFPMHINRAKQHLGLNKRFASGFEWMFDHIEEEVIILEDDTIPSPDFFKFCEYYLRACKDNPGIVVLNGSFRLNAAHPIRNKIQSPFLNKIMSPWGWATWKSKFIPIFKPSFTKLSLYDQLMILLKIRSMDLFYRRLNILNKTINGELDVWGVQCQWSIMLAGKYVLTSHKNLITNNGLDEYATTQGGNYHNRLFANLETIDWDKISPVSNFKHLHKYDIIAYNAKSNFVWLIGEIKSKTKKIIKVFNGF